MLNENALPLVLIVDDEPANILIMAENLRASYRISVATSGQAALDIIGSDKPDLILLDVMMPEMDGYEVLCRLKENPDTQGIPVIFVTSMSNARDEEHGLSLGAVDYISKPISPGILKARVRNQISLRQAAVALQEREREFRTLAENIPDNVIRYDCEGRVLYINKTLEATLNRPAAELIGKTIEENFPDGSFAALDEAVRRVGVTGEGAVIEHFMPGPDGEPRYHSIRVVAEPGVDDRPMSILAVGRDLTVQKKAEEELRLADQRKDEFLAMLAHELRNPLAPIRNAAHIIGRLGLEEPRIKWAQGVIETQVTHLTRMVDDLLDVSRIVRGKITLQKEEVEFADLAKQVLETARPFMEGKKHRLIVNLPAEPVRLDVDPVRLSQVLLNLLDNAAKYTQDNGRIEFDAHVSGQEIEIQVRDNGEGISQELLNRVFDIFQQGERSLDRAKGGLGIGLTLVQRMVGLHGGRVEARSEGPGRGSTLIVRLPIILSQAHGD